MPQPRATRVVLAVVGVLMCGLPLTGLSLVSAPEPLTDSSLRLVGGTSCPGFTARDVRRGRAPKRAATCRPLGLDAGIVRFPISKALQRDRRNYGKRHGHGRKRHTGTDFKAPCRTMAVASHAGKVVVPRQRGRRPVTVGVSTGPRRLTTWYGHLKHLRVRNGALVKAGRPLGKVARVGRSRCHLHFAVHLRAGTADPLRVNPSWWLRRHHGRHVSGMAPLRVRGAFVAATLNVLGHSHTAHRGKKRRQFAGSSHRMNHAISLLGSNRVSLVGLQELQPVQRRMFLRRTRGWRMYSPRTDPQDSIAWRTARFRLVRAGTVMVPYFRRDRPMPVVRLRDRTTGRMLSVISVHNPARRGRVDRMVKRRAEAVRREVRLAHRIRRAGYPVLLLGDFNDKSRRFYCSMVRRGLKASSGGIPGRGRGGRGCRPSQVAGIDWIFGTRGIRFLGHQRVSGGLVGRATDHPFVIARVRR